MVGFLLVSLGFSSCGGDDSPSGSGSSESVTCTGGTVVEGRPIRIASTVAPITNIVANVASGTDAVIEGLVPEGTNSHTFEPPPSAAETLEKADIIFINGLVLEEPTKDLALANLADGATICELGTEILPESEWIFDFSFPKEGGKPNPHLWTNPPMAKDYARVVADALSERDPANAETYASNLAKFSTKVDELDAAVRAASETLPAAARKLVTYHDAYAYFAKQYGWTVVGAIQPSSFEEPTPKEIADLITQVKKEGVKAVFGSEVFPSPVLEQIGKEAGVTYIDVLRDDDLLGEPGDAEHTWMGLMRFNYVTMVEALGGDASALKALDVSDIAKDSAFYPQ
ncbi:MAG: zinc ABC transporter substrate-binding protein [Ilumatobacteraceae bacterium]|nr:zinc ABC transporter substrate-binding protein [Ilumatobacteraceae bacterium]